jgi:hypothetical protein
MRKVGSADLFIAFYGFRSTRGKPASVLDQKLSNQLQ